MYFKKDFLVLLFTVAIVFNGCKKWDTDITNPDINQNLVEAIASNTNLSTFSDYLKRTGLDILLQSSKPFTVWAPDNTALQALDPAIVNDTAKLKVFLLNHISNQSYFSRDVNGYTRIGMLNGKYNNYFGNKFEDATVTAADKYVSNGVLHVIDKIVPVLQNVWEFINSTTSQYLQNSFIASLNYQSFDPNTATIDSISALTGLPVYRPGTGLSTKNTFNERVFDVRREDKQYTYFVIANAGFTLKADSLKPYYKTTSTSATDSLSKYNVVKDLIVDTLYPTIASLPNSLVSKFGIPIPINKSLIIDSKKVSNGMVYVLSLSSTTTASKFLPVVIQGENPDGFSRSDKSGNINYRVRKNPVTGFNFTDLYLTATNITGAGSVFYSYYTLNEMPSMKYNVYGSAVNDFQTGALVQNIVVLYKSAPSVYTSLAALAYNVPLNTAAGAYNEILLGQFTSTLYGTLEIRLTQSANGTTGTNTASVLDYLRIVPVP